MNNSMFHQQAAPATSGYEAASSTESAQIGAPQSEQCGDSQANQMIWSTENTARRRVFFSIRGNLCDLEAGNNMWKFTNEWAIAYRKHEDQRGAPRVGNVDRALIQAVFVNWVSNTFDKPVAVCSKELKGNCYSNKKNMRAIITCPARKCLHFPKGKRVYFADSTFNDPMMRQHGDLTKKDLKCKMNYGYDQSGQMYPYYVVPRNHPIGWLITRNSRDVTGDPMSYTVGRNTATVRHTVPLDDENCFRVAPEFWTQAYESYKKKVLDVVNFNKMRGLDLFLACPDGSFTSDDYIEDMCGDTADLDALKKSCRSVTGEIEIVYRLAGHGLVGSNPIVTTSSSS